MHLAVREILQHRGRYARALEQRVGLWAIRVDRHVVVECVGLLRVEPRVKLDRERVLEAFKAHLAALLGVRTGVRARAERARLVRMRMDHERKAIAAVHRARAVVAHAKVLVLDLHAALGLVRELECEARLEALEHGQWLCVPYRGHLPRLRRREPQPHGAALTLLALGEQVAVTYTRCFHCDPRTARVVFRLGRLDHDLLQQLVLHQLQRRLADVVRACELTVLVLWCHTVRLVTIRAHKTLCKSQLTHPRHARAAASRGVAVEHEARRAVEIVVHELCQHTHSQVSQL